MTLRFAEDASLVGRVGERTVAVVVVEVVALAVGPALRVEDVGLDVDVEPAVAIVITERRHVARVVQREAAGGRLLGEGAVALVDIEEIGRTEAADVEVEPPVVVHVGEGRTLFPRAQRAGHAGFFRHILELEPAQVAVEVVGTGLADHEDIGPAVAVIVPDRDPRADRPEGKFAVVRAPHRRVIVVVYLGDAGLLGRQGGEQRGARPHGARIERPGRQAGRFGRQQPSEEQPGRHHRAQPKAPGLPGINGMGKRSHAGLGQKVFEAAIWSWPAEGFWSNTKR